MRVLRSLCNKNAIPHLFILQWHANFNFSLSCHPRCFLQVCKICIYTILHDLAIEMLWHQSIIIRHYSSFKSTTIFQRIFRGVLSVWFCGSFFNWVWPRDKKIWSHLPRQGICKSFRHGYLLGLITTVVSLPFITLTLFYSFHRWNRILLLEHFTHVSTGYYCGLHPRSKYFINIDTMLNMVLNTSSVCYTQASCDFFFSCLTAWIFLAISSAFPVILEYHIFVG